MLEAARGGFAVAIFIPTPSNATSGSLTGFPPRHLTYGVTAPGAGDCYDGRKAVVAPGDISEEAHCRSLLERTVAELGRLDLPATMPAELAPLFVFLASDESSYITGEVVGVTGDKPLA